MVREGQVGAAALDVEAHAEVFEGDRGAFDVPSGTARAQGAIPRGLPGTGGTPEQSVERILLVGPLRIAAALGEQVEHVGPAQPGHVPEVLVCLDGEVQVAVDVVGGALLAQSLH